MQFAKEYFVAQVPKETVLIILKHNHYLKRIPNIKYAFALYKNNLLMGVCTFGLPPSHTLCYGIFKGKFQKEILELNRLFLTKNTKNLASFFISKCLKQLPKPKVIISFADTSADHHGYIYQASNWIYTGLSSKFTDYAVKGLEHLHHASIGDSVGRHDRNPALNKQEALQRKYGNNLYKKQRARKHRYIYVLASKKDKRERLANLQYKILQYPKGNNITYAVGDIEPTQGLLI
tara:strand:- start:67 stop:768 length:702 start_codon:yes stop_codon:yes gene_type:complete